MVDNVFSSKFALNYDFHFQKYLTLVCSIRLIMLMTNCKTVNIGIMIFHQLFEFRTVCFCDIITNQFINLTVLLANELFHLFLLSKLNQPHFFKVEETGRVGEVIITAHFLTHADTMYYQTKLSIIEITINCNQDIFSTALRYIIYHIQPIIVCIYVP